MEDSTIVLKYIETQRQVADLLTKPLGKIAFERLRDDLTGYLAFNKPLENIHVKMCRIKMQCVNPKKRTYHSVSKVSVMRAALSTKTYETTGVPHPPLRCRYESTPGVSLECTSTGKAWFRPVTTLMHASLLI